MLPDQVSSTEFEIVKQQIAHTEISFSIESPTSLGHDKVMYHSHGKYVMVKVEASGLFGITSRSLTKFQGTIEYIKSYHNENRGKTFLLLLSLSEHVLEIRHHPETTKWLIRILRHLPFGLFFTHHDDDDAL